jgi:hypothetical protein
MMRKTTGHFNSECQEQVQYCQIRTSYVPFQVSTQNIPALPVRDIILYPLPRNIHAIRTRTNRTRLISPSKSIHSSTNSSGDPALMPVFVSSACDRKASALCAA